VLRDEQARLAKCTAASRRSPGTHVRAILRKLQRRDRVQIVVFAQETGHILTAE
jgi:DNA-binding NarL/FixJ family response regulator